MTTTLQSQTDRAGYVPSSVRYRVTYYRRAWDDAFGISDSRTFPSLVSAMHAATVARDAGFEAFISAGV